MDSGTIILLVVVFVVLGILAERFVEAWRKLPRYPWAFHCDTCGLQGSTDDLLFRDQVIRDHVLKGHKAGPGWVA